MSLHLLFALVIFSHWSCGDRGNNAPQVKSDTDTKSEEELSYKLNHPDVEMILPMSLIEISGLSYDLQANQLLAINDERGQLYRLNDQTGKVESSVRFRGKGDYEGVEMIGDDIYVCESDGQILKVDSSSEKGSIKLRTDLRGVNDIEGLGYDPQNNSLLLACKGNPSISSDQDLAKVKSIYSYNLTSQQLSPDPIMIIGDQDIEDFLRQYKRIQFKTDKEKKQLRKRAKSFAPSGIARHPETGAYFIISSSGKLLIVADQSGDIMDVYFLKEKVHRQPEGICFDDAGHLYISNEGRSGIGKIYKYKLG